MLSPVRLSMNETDCFNLVLLQEEGKEAILQLRSSALWHLSLEMST